MRSRSPSPPRRCCSPGCTEQRRRDGRRDHAGQRAGAVASGAVGGRRRRRPVRTQRPAAAVRPTGRRTTARPTAPASRRHAGGARPAAGRRAARSSNGAVYASPVVVGGTMVVATEDDTRVRLRPPTATGCWKQQLGTPRRAGEQLPCGNIDPLGITGTPVVAATARSTSPPSTASPPRHELVALDLATGAVRWHRSIDLPGVETQAMQERGALAVTGGRVWVPFGGLAGDCGGYKGRVVGVPPRRHRATRSPTPCRPRARPASGRRPARRVDAAGDLFVAVGNGASVRGRPLRLQRLGARDQPDGQAARLVLADDLGRPTTPPTSTSARRARRWSARSGCSPPASPAPRTCCDQQHLGGIGGEVSQAELCPSFGGTAVVGDVVLRAVHRRRAGRAASTAPGTMHVLWHADADHRLAGRRRRPGLVARRRGRRAARPRPDDRRRPLEQVTVGATSRFATPALYGRYVLVPTAGRAHGRPHLLTRRRSLGSRRARPRHRFRRPRARAVPGARRTTPRSPRWSARPATPGRPRSPSSAASTRPTARPSPRSPRRAAPTWSSSAPRRRSSPASPTRCAPRGIACFGPSAAAAQLEGSKAFAKDVMAAAGVPTARRPGVHHRRPRPRPRSTSSAPPYVVKDDGLAAGKGVVVTDRPRRGAGPRRRVRPGGHRGVPRRPRGVAVLPHRRHGGRPARPGAGLQAHRRRRHRTEHRRHGRLRPARLAAGRLHRARSCARSPSRRSTRCAGAARRSPGCSTSAWRSPRAGPRVVEFNARFGDPETQVVLALLDTPLAGVLRWAADRRRRRRSCAGATGSAVTVVLRRGRLPGHAAHRRRHHRQPSRTA